MIDVKQPRESQEDHFEDDPVVVDNFTKGISFAMVVAVANDLRKKNVRVLSSQMRLHITNTISTAGLAFGMQLMLLYYFFVLTRPNISVPLPLLFVAELIHVYASFPHVVEGMNVYKIYSECVKPFRIPDDSPAAKHVRVARALTWLTVVVDGFVIPYASLWLGGRFLRSSESISDMILNCVAVRFVPQIDNFLVNALDTLLTTQFEYGEGLEKYKLPKRSLVMDIGSTMKILTWCLSYPVVPVGVACALAFIPSPWAAM